MAEFRPRYQDIAYGTRTFTFGQTSQTSFGVNCRLLWICENKSQFQDDLELIKGAITYI